jgi:CBS domain-containing protein
MRARDIAVAMPTVTVGDSVATAVKKMAAERLPGLIVVDDFGRPRAVLPGTQVLRMIIGLEFQEDAALVRAVDEAHADSFWRPESARSVLERLPAKAVRDSTVGADATLLEVASLMARKHSPLIAVVAEDGSLLGGITLSLLLEHLDLSAAPT